MCVFFLPHAGTYVQRILVDDTTQPLNVTKKKATQCISALLVRSYTTQIIVYFCG